MPHGGINRGGGELLLPPSNTRTTVAGAALAATGAVPKVYTAVAGASSSGPPSLITDIHEGLRASDFQTMDTDFAEGRRPMGLQMGKTLDDRNAAWWAERKFQESAYLENLRQQELDVAAFHEERRAKEYAETTAEYKEYVKKALAEVAPAVAGHGMPLPAMLQASIILLATVRGEGAAAHGMVMHQAEVATRQGCDTHVFYFTALYSVVVVFLTVFVTRVLVERGWLWTATLTAPPASRTCSKATQSQVTYTYVSNPLRSEFRFAPLPERDQGCWLVA